MLRKKIIEIIDKVPARQAQVCYRVNINKNIIKITPTVEYFDWSRTSAGNFDQLYRNMVFHAGLCVGALEHFFNSNNIKYRVATNFEEIEALQSKNSRTVELIFKRNIDLITAEIHAYIEKQINEKNVKYTNFVYDKEKCNRDFLFLIDALLHDVDTNSNIQTINISKKFFDTDNNCLVRNICEVDVHKHILKCIQKIIKNEHFDYIQKQYKPIFYPTIDNEAIELLLQNYNLFINCLSEGIDTLPEIIYPVYPNNYIEMEIDANI